MSKTIEKTCRSVPGYSLDVESFSARVGYWREMSVRRLPQSGIAETAEWRRGETMWRKAQAKALQRRSPCALNHTSGRFCHLQANAWPSGRETLRVALCLARTMTDLQCRQAADKPGGRLRPHYASPLASSPSSSNADRVSRPYKIFAYPYFCACLLLSLCLAATAETRSTGLSTTLLCTSTTRYLHDDNRRSVSPPRDCKRLRAGEGLGFLHVERG